MERPSEAAIFVAVVEAGGFSRAAERLELTKSAVSRRVSALERRLGTRLLLRTTRRLSLTEAGELYLGHAREALRQLEAAEEAVRRAKGAPAGRLRIHAPMSFGKLQLAPRLARFLARYPELRLDLILDDKSPDLVEAGIDLSLRVGALPDSTLVSRRLTRLRSVVCAAPDYLRHHPPPEHPEGLADHPCLFYSYSDNRDCWEFKDAAGSRRMVVTAHHQVNNSEVLCELLAQGAGVGRVPTYVAASWIRAGRLIPLFPHFEMPTRPLNIVMPGRERIPAKVELFRDYLIDTLGGETPEWDRVVLGAEG